jgi:hypothetical protein
MGMLELVKRKLSLPDVDEVLETGISVATNISEKYVIQQKLFGCQARLNVVLSERPALKRGAMRLLAKSARSPSFESPVKTPRLLVQLFKGLSQEGGQA